MSTLTICRRIQSGFAAVILIMGALGFAAYLRLTAIGRQSAQITDQDLPGLYAAGQIEVIAGENARDLAAHVATTNLEEKTELARRIQSRQAANDQYFSDYEKTISEAADRDGFAQLKAARTNFLQARGEVLALSTELKTTEAAALLNSRFEAAASKYRELISAELDWKRNHTRTTADSIRRAIKLAQSAIIIGLAGALCAGLWVSWLITSSINRLLRRALTGLGANAREMLVKVSQLAASGQALAEAASEQAASLEETSATLEEISSKTKRNAQNAHAATDLARQTRSLAETGAVEMQAMNTAVEDIKTSSDNISRIIKAIDEIAFQTNILALNAAVEAARAGEAGLGFAVVADEVRNLAQRSAQAARETGQMIQDSVQKSRRGAELSTKISASLQQILGKVRQVDELVGQIAGATQEQNQGVGQVALAVSQMDKVTQSTAATAEQSAGMSAELNGEAEKLQRVVNELGALVGNNRSQTDFSSGEAVQPQTEPVKIIRNISPVSLPESRNSIPLPPLVETTHTAALEAHASQSARALAGPVTAANVEEDFLEWDQESMSCGETSVDDQHKSLIANLNKLHRAHCAGAGREEVKKMIDFLGEYAVKHFQHEEGVMENRQCPSRQKNKEAHAQFLQQFQELSAKFAREKDTGKMVAQIKNVVSRWLVNHICRVDTGLRSCARSCPAKNAVLTR